jgi:hypothetical protein
MPTCPVCLPLFPAQHCSILRYFFPQAGTGVNYRPSGAQAWKKRRPAIRVNLFIQETEWYGKELSAKPYRGCSFDGPKEPKAPGRNNHPADSLYRRLCQGGKYCGRDASPNKGKKAKQRQQLAGASLNRPIGVLHYFRPCGIAWLTEMLACRILNN